MKLNLIAALVLVGTCMTCCIDYHGNIDNELVPYVKEYKGLLTEYCQSMHYNTTKNYAIVFVPEMEKVSPTLVTVGICYRYLNGFKIEISREFWNRATAADRASVMYHELSHCLINKEHVKDPFNYMYPNTSYVSYETLIKQVTADIKERCTIK